MKRISAVLLTLVFSLSIMFQLVPTAFADTDYDSYRAQVESIDNGQLRNTEQLHRLNQYYKKITGMCNLCAMETLLNRRVAYDFGDYSSPFDDYKMFAAVGVSDLGSGKYEYANNKYGYYLSGGVGNAQSSSTSYRYSDSVTYRPVLLGNTDVTNLINNTGYSGLDAQYQAIASLLRQHPEGIWLRAQYGKDGPHAIVITDYTIENGQVQLYGIDSVNVRSGVGRSKIENLWFYGNNYKNGMISDTSSGRCRINIAYLEQAGGSTATYPPAGTVQQMKPTLSISGENYPSSLNEGDNFGIRGTITTDYGTITYVYGAITDASGYTVQSSEYRPNTSSHNLRYSINNDLIFNRLSAGTYTYTVQATAKNGSEETSQTLISQSFSVGGGAPVAVEATPTLSISGQNAPSSQRRGSNFGIRGVVSTDCGQIVWLYGAIYDANGNVVQSSYYNPDSASVNLRYTINNDLIFNRLASGSYTYCVQATARNGSQETTQTLIYSDFTVS